MMAVTLSNLIEYSFTGFWDTAGNRKTDTTHRHTPRLWPRLYQLFQSCLRLWKQKWNNITRAAEIHLPARTSGQVKTKNHKPVRQVIILSSAVMISLKMISLKLYNFSTIQDEIGVVSSAWHNYVLPQKWGRVQNPCLSSFFLFNSRYLAHWARQYCSTVLTSIPKNVHKIIFKKYWAVKMYAG